MQSFLHTVYIEGIVLVYQREVVSTKNIDPLLAPASSSVNIRRPASLGDNNGLSATAAATGEVIVRPFDLRRSIDRLKGTGGNVLLLA